MSDLNITNDELRQVVEVLESIMAEKEEVQSRFKEQMAEAKSRGFDTKVLRKLLSIRKRNREDIEEEEAVLEIYMRALGMV